MNEQKTALVINKTISVTEKIISIIILVFFGMMCIAALATLNSEGADTMLVFSLIMIILGILLLKKANKTNTLINNFKKYVAVFSNVPNGSIPDMAASLNQSEDVVTKNIEQMIQRHFFVDAYIDKDLNSLIIRNKQSSGKPKQQNQSNTNSTSNSASKVEMMTVKCDGCGGINTIQKGTVGECDYCGSPIKG